MLAHERLGYSLLAFVILMAFSLLLSSSPIPQPVEYHRFADTRGWLFIPNALNVISNLPFVIIGALGLKLLPTRQTHSIKLEDSLMAYRLLWLGTFLLGFGSAYYHLSPDNDTLVWDRLPIALSLMALNSIVIGEFLSDKWGRKLLLPLVLFGLFATAYWWWTERQEAGDVRLYLLSQFIPMLAIPVLLLCFKTQHKNTLAYLLLLLVYSLAKLAEHFDHEIFAFTGIISGHTLKHLFAAAGLYILLRAQTQMFAMHKNPSLPIRE